MSIADKLTYLSETKALIKQAIINKGVAVGSGDTFRSFASKIGLISPIPRSTAKLIKTGVNSSLVPFDDGHFKSGRSVDFFTLDSPPVHNDGSPTINTTTNRFTDILGGQTYATPIMLDWDTWDGFTVLAYKRTATNVFSGGITASCLTCSNLSVGTFTSGWRIANRTEWQNVLNSDLANPLGYTAMSSFTFTFSSFTGTPYKPVTSSYYWGVSSVGSVYAKDRNETSSCLAVRTMNLSTSNVLS